MQATRSTACKPLALLAIVAIVVALVLAVAPSAHAAGSGTITVTGLRDGDVVNAYQVVKAQGDGYGFSDNYGIDMGEYMELLDDSTAMRAVADKMASRATKDAPTAQATAANGAGATLSGLEPGQYLLTVTCGSAGSGLVYQNTVVSLLDVSGQQLTATAELKSVPVSIEKLVDGKKSTDAYGLGDQVPFTVDVTVPSYPPSAINTTFSVVDTMTHNLAFAQNTFTVTCGEDELKAGSDYTLSFDATDDGAPRCQIDFDYDSVRPYANQTIRIAYAATLLEGALPAADEVNHAQLVFANNPFDESSRDYKDDEVTVKTYGIHLLKVSADDTSDVLPGAEFEVYREEEGGRRTQVAENDYRELALVTTMVSDESGIAQCTCLGAGIYYIIESKAPTGFTADPAIRTRTVDSTTVETQGTFAGYFDLGAIENPPTGDTPPNNPSDDENTPSDDSKTTTTSKTGTTSTPSSGGSSILAKTGDTALPIACAICLSVIASAVLAAALRIQRRKGG